MVPVGPVDAGDFRRWYARRLYRGYAMLTTCLLSGVLIAVILEFIGLDTPGITPLVTLTVLYFVGLMGVESFRRFWLTLKHAQHYADGATCSRCDAYGQFEVHFEGTTLPATCRRCGHAWSIDPPPRRSRGE